MNYSIVGHETWKYDLNNLQLISHPLVESCKSTIYHEI